jgi:hypothetical protein
MTELAAWLLEQIAEDENQARAATPGPWKFVHGYLGIPGRRPAITQQVDLNPATIRYLTALAPERVLAECDAKREILDVTRGTYSEDLVQRLMALAYADRPGYRKEWRP